MTRPRGREEGAPIADRYDVIVVGARCAGAPLAALLARQGMKVALIERATFPKDTLSTHIFQASAIKFLKRLGVYEKVLATGARPCTGIDLRQEDFRCTFEANRRPGDEGAFMCVRRFRLDPILLDTATDAGVEAHMGTNVTGLVRAGERVVGVSTVRAGERRTLRAKLVVAADGRNSTVAELVGARKYNVAPSQRFLYWAFFADADPEPDRPLVYHRWDGRFVAGMSADNGLYLVVVIPDGRFLPEFRQDREAAFMAHARVCAPIAATLRGAHQVGRLLGILRFECFFREATGPGWVLAGDAGHFKDPAPGQGIADAFRQVETLAPVIARAINQPQAKLDMALAHWARWRDRDAAEYYWLAADFGAAGRAPSVLVEATRQLHGQGRAADLGDTFQHRRKPSSVITPTVLLKAAASAMRRPGADRGMILRELRELITNDARRRRLARSPEFVPTDQQRDAGETDVPEEVAA